jgi:NADH:ubiquinone oxidoreductase subunit 3 (subunit A)
MKSMYITLDFVSELDAYINQQYYVLKIAQFHFFLVFETEVVFLAVWSPYSQQL